MTIVKIMKKILLVLAVAVCAVVATPCYGKGKVVKGSPKTLDSLSYVTGMMVGVTLLEQNALPMSDMSFDDLNKGVENSLLRRSKITAAEADKENTAILEAAYNRAVSNVIKQAGKADQTLLQFTKAESKKISYNVGVTLGEYILTTIEAEDFTIHCYWLCKAIDDVCVKQSPLLTIEQVNDFVNRH